jgi:hypothetical protein
LPPVCASERQLAPVYVNVDSAKRTHRGHIPAHLRVPLATVAATGKHRLRPRPTFIM